MGPASGVARPVAHGHSTCRWRSPPRSAVPGWRSTGGADSCTACDGTLFYSHRARHDQGRHCLGGLDRAAGRRGRAMTTAIDPGQVADRVAAVRARMDRAGGAERSARGRDQGLPDRCRAGGAGRGRRRHRRELLAGDAGQSARAGRPRHRSGSGAMALPRPTAAQQGPRAWLRTCTCGRASIGPSSAPRSPSGPRVHACWCR